MSDYIPWKDQTPEQRAEEKRRDQFNRERFVAWASQPHTHPPEFAEAFEDLAMEEEIIRDDRWGYVPEPPVR